MKYDKPLCIETGRLLLRLAVALPFLIHGWQKLANMEVTIGFFQGLNMPSGIAYAVSAVEFLGGVAMIAGVWTRVAAWAFAAIMAAAIYLVTGSGGYVGYEFNVVLLLASLGIACTGPGKLTLAKLAGAKD
jgi:uncharacterized membrane protein YphA (DoxX/SURF4 family)